MLKRTAISTLALALLAVPANTSAQDRVLFAGNSYTFYSGGLEVMVDALLEESTGATVDTQSVTAGGYRLTQHLADADGSNGDRPLRQALVTGPDTDWNLVVLQEQSQIPGFPRGQTDWIQSRNAAVRLDELIEPTGAHTMFFVTWGRRDGDSENPGRFRDYRTMQGLLTDGYLAYRDASSTESRPTYVAPVGPAFELVYDDVLVAGRTPEDAGTAFYRLYAGDGSHPSTEGSYLAACVFFAAYSGVSPVGLEWAPAGVDSESRDYLQAIAAEVVFEATADWPYPWTGDGGGDADVGGEDVGVDDVGGDDAVADAPDPDTAEDVPSEDSRAETGSDVEGEEAVRDSADDSPEGDGSGVGTNTEGEPVDDVDRGSEANRSGGSADSREGCASARPRTPLWAVGMFALLGAQRRR